MITITIIIIKIILTILLLILIVYYCWFGYVVHSIIPENLQLLMKHTWVYSRGREVSSWSPRAEYNARHPPLDIYIFKILNSNLCLSKVFVYPIITQAPLETR